MTKPLKKSQIDKMVDRFLGWKLPADFNPDCGISFKREFNEHMLVPTKHEPTGTNLLNAIQAKAMLEYVLGAIVPAPDRFSTEEEGDAFTHGFMEGRDECLMDIPPAVLTALDAGLGEALAVIAEGLPKALNAWEKDYVGCRGLAYRLINDAAQAQKGEENI